MLLRRRENPRRGGSSEDAERGPLWPPVLGLLFAGNLTWHPQGPIHRSTLPRATTFRGGGEVTRNVVARGGDAGRRGPCGCQVGLLGQIIPSSYLFNEHIRYNRYYICMLHQGDPNV